MNEIKTTEEKLKPVRGRPIKKGQVLNPYGRPKLTPDQNRMRFLTKADIAEAITKIWAMPFEELRTLATKQEGVPSGQLIIARIIFAAAQKSDTGRMDAILNRAIGKPKEEIVLTGGMVNTNLIGSAEKILSNPELRKAAALIAESLSEE